MLNVSLTQCKLVKPFQLASGGVYGAVQSAPMAGRGSVSSTEYRRDVARRLVEMREARGLKQAELCRKADIRSSQLSQYETAQRDIPRERALDIVIALDGSLDFLFLGKIDGLEPEMRAKILARRRSS